MLKRKFFRLMILAWVSSIFFWCQPVRAMPVGTLLFRTSNDNALYGYNKKELVAVDKGSIRALYTGHVAIYVGQENGVDYIVEAAPTGIIKVPAKYFINSRNGEKLIAAKIPKNLTPQQQEKVVELAEAIATSGAKYDFSLASQKGPGSGDWTCVGLTEKIYESANISNPNNLQDLVYNTDEYAINITPDGYDNSSVYNQATKDCFSKEKEFSKISRITDIRLPLPELIGYDAGKIYQGERYFFLPYTQSLQPTLKDVPVDITLESDFSDTEIKGPMPRLSILFRWSLINNPLNSVKVLAAQTGKFLASLKDKLILDKKIMITDEALASSSSRAVVKKTATVKKTTTAKKTTTTTKKTTAAKKAVPVTTKKTTTIKATATAKGTKAATTSVKASAVKTKTTTVPKNIIAKIPATVDPDPPASVINNYTNVVNNPEPVRHTILISKIQATGDDDYIELYNPNNETIDLAQENFRLEKAKTAVDPGIIMRIGNESDGTYPGGTEIEPRGTYLIVRDEASLDLRNLAQAIATNTNFSWDSDGYTFYLGNNAISNDADADIVDMVGFGPSATYFAGQGPAAEITNGSYLVRKAKASSTAGSMKPGGADDSQGFGYNSQNNQKDFVLIQLESDDGETDIDNNDNNNGDSDNDSNIDDESGDNIDTSDNTDDSDINSEEEVDNDSDVDDSSDTDIDEGNDEEDNSDLDNTDSEVSNDDNAATSTPARIVIGEIYTTAEDDYIELYNAGGEDFDLAANNYRLEKTKTAGDPAILMRFGNESDGTYPGGTVIAAYGSYLIVRDDASADLKAAADALALGSNFTFSSSGYTIYLGQDAISSDSDADIVDMVGFGDDAAYYEGHAPAPEILDDYLLVRKATATSTRESMAPGGNDEDNGHGYDSDDNADDFVRLSLGGEDDSGEETGAAGFVSPGLIHLWHFDECRGNDLADSVGSDNLNGNNIWRVGKFGCALEQYYNYQPLAVDFPDSLDVSNLSLSFNYLATSNNPRIYFKFSNSSDQDYLQLKLSPFFTEYWGLPNNWRENGLLWPADNEWHQLTLVINSSEDYWELYLDGELVYQKYFEAIFSGTYDHFEVGGDNGYNYLDELAMWDRSLSAAEVAELAEVDNELSPATERLPQSDPQKIHYWSFDERTGTLAADSIGPDDLTIPDSFWIRNGQSNGGISHYWKTQRNLEVSFADPIASDDLSLEFWWRNSGYPNEGRGQFKLLTADRALFGLTASPYNSAYFFNGYYDWFNQGFDNVLPNDGDWHHLALVYDSYEYSLKLYVDGELNRGWSYAWLLDEPIVKMQIEAQNWTYEIDELGIWQGALSAAQVKAIYQGN